MPGEPQKSIEVPQEMMGRIISALSAAARAALIEYFNVTTLHGNESCLEVFAKDAEDIESLLEDARKLRSADKVQQTEGSRLRLFVWPEFSPDYNNGLAFAIAKDEADARAQICEKLGYPVQDWGTLEVRSLTRRIARCACGGG